MQFASCAVARTEPEVLIRTRRRLLCSGGQCWFVIHLEVEELPRAIDRYRRDGSLKCFVARKRRLSPYDLRTIRAALSDVFSQIGYPLDRFGSL